MLDEMNPCFDGIGKCYFLQYNTQQRFSGYICVEPEKAIVMHGAGEKKDISRSDTQGSQLCYNSQILYGQWRKP